MLYQFCVRSRDCECLTRLLMKFVWIRAFECKVLWHRDLDAGHREFSRELGVFRTAQGDQQAGRARRARAGGRKHRVKGSKKLGEEGLAGSNGDPLLPGRADN